MGNNNGSAIQSVDRALLVLSLLAQHGELGVTEIAAELEVHKSTAFRLVATLESHELVERHAQRGRYRLGVGLLRLAGATATRLDVVQCGRPVIERLAEEVGETVNITVLSEGEALYVDQVAGSGALGPHNWVGQRIPLHATSNGKVLLAQMTASSFEELLSVTRKRFTHHTIVDKEALRAEVDTVRRQGFAIAVDELEIGLTAISAPIAQSDGSVVASVSVSGPGFRLPEERVASIASQVVEAGREISSSLGWHGLPNPL
jgi:DNA-binding IclR family transcriptional regulator